MNIPLIYLRALELNDYKFINNLRKDKGVFSNIMGNKLYISSEREKIWIKKLIYDDSKIYWAICLIADHKMIGYCSINDIDWRNKKAKIGGITTSTNYRNKGHGYEAIKLVLNYAFNELGLNRLTVVYKEDNKITKHGIKKFGFKKELLLREHIYKEGKFHNVVHASMLKSEYKKYIKNEK